MANGRVITGFSDVYVAKYSNTDGTTTYSVGVPLGRGVSLSLDVNFSEDNILYADNQAAEKAYGEFSDGTATITIDGLPGETEALVIGLTAAEEVTIGNGGSKKASVYKYGDSAQAAANVALSYNGKNIVNGETLTPVTGTKPLTITVKNGNAVNVYTVTITKS